MNAEDIITYWQNVLGLQDWRIFVRTGCKPEELHIEETVAEVELGESRKIALIRVLDEQYYPETATEEYDMEKAILHELLHIKTAFLSGDQPPLFERVLHQIVGDLARAFVTARRDALEEGAKK